MKIVSVVIPTFNRYEDLIVTIPQVVKYIDDYSELIIFDQSTNYSPEEKKKEILSLIGDIKFRYYHSSIASVTLAWNTAASLAEGDIILFLDDDINIEENIIEKHRQKYLDQPNIYGVAGSYYASSYSRVWIPSAKNGRATALAGVNASFRKCIFEESGVVSNFIRPFAGFDWEIAEHVNQKFGDLIVGDDILVFHRAPLTGGCGNQSKRDENWYFGAYHNHFLWLFNREFPKCITRLPRHIYWIVRYCLPNKNLFWTKKFIENAVFKGFTSAWKTHQVSGKVRQTKKIENHEYKILINNRVDKGLNH